MGIFGRTISAKDTHEKDLEKALKIKQGESNLPKLKKKRSSLFGTQGDPHELLEVLENPSDGDLKSFVPASLQCLNKFQPSCHFHRPKDMNEVLGMAGHAPTAAQQAVVSLQNMKMDGPGGVHALAVLGGFAVIGGAALNFLHNLMHLSPLHMFFSCMLCVFGVVTVILEQQQTIFPRTFRAMLEEYFLFLRIISGRGIFFLYIGTIQASIAWKTSSINVIIGFYMIFVGFMYIFVGRSVEAKLRQIRAMLQSPTFITLAFDDYDVDRNGYLDMEELGKLIAVLGSTLPAEEVMVWMDKNGDGKISKEEFVDWMERPQDSH
mmetsp:Transcript_1919/g.2546  ORF Transcript_1919/g.2546 Transcript_1919/m.2546 type:complete len:321 (-) Transcript_1919:73-1035(-)|eukprot:CAMPEP_0114340888 /NCGR_PEP_ID=MMETSP0101-20121206/8665_1 /TAXON_ID=38822 ORGANISM="Pteridomonas danica, Strain PT" /NCGR_SAMPLE_ID=MMETSP0101 /ASSEMBLY_ACC=CAM_ASM_000211 /LENGTH=320 /DNA_ID=CAMNT_0001474277 /DNA_START=314 /DNA_END=1276 /DNA_ORIENTATION=-